MWAETAETLRAALEDGMQKQEGGMKN